MFAEASPGEKMVCGARPHRMGWGKGQKVGGAGGAWQAQGVQGASTVWGTQEAGPAWPL